MLRHRERFLTGPKQPSGTILQPPRGAFRRPAPAHPDRWLSSLRDQAAHLARAGAGLRPAPGRTTRAPRPAVPTIAHTAIGRRDSAATPHQGRATSRPRRHERPKSRPDDPAFPAGPHAGTAIDGESALSCPTEAGRLSESPTEPRAESADRGSTIDRCRRRVQPGCCPRPPRRRAGFPTIGQPSFRASPLGTAVHVEPARLPVAPG